MEDIARLKDQLESQKATTQKTVLVGPVTCRDTANCKRHATGVVCRLRWVGRGEGLGVTLVRFLLSFQRHYRIRSRNLK